MSNLQQINKQVIPQWKEAYMNYQILHLLLKIIQINSWRRSQQQKLIIKNEQQRIQQFDDIHMHQQGSEPQNAKPTTTSQFYLSIKQQHIKSNQEFTNALHKQLKIFQMFINHKLQQIRNDFDKAIKCSSILKDKGKQQQQQKLYKQKLLPYLEMLYIQIGQIASMYYCNLQIQRNIIGQYQRAGYGYFQGLSAQVSNRFNIRECYIFMREIQQFYIRTSTKQNMKNRLKLRQLHSNIIRNFGDHIMFGILSGIFIAILIFFIVILLYLKQQKSINQIFKYDLPLWGGIVILLIYNWVLGINIYHYQKYNINYVNIFQFNPTKYASSPSFFKPAIFFSILTILLFLLYTLDLCNYIALKNMNPQFLSMIIWLLYGFYVLNPISQFYFKSRDYLIKIIVHCLISFALKIREPIVYTSEQFVSAFIPIHAAFFSSCYYTHFQRTDNNQQSLQSHSYDCYPPTYIAIFVFMVFILVMRIIQCVKLVYQTKPYNLKQFGNAGKYTVALITTILSFSITNQNRQIILPIWIVFAIITILYTYIWDIKYDWLLLQKDIKCQSQYLFGCTNNNKNSILRNRLTYNKSLYYCIIIINLFLRLSWVFTLSTNIIHIYFNGPQMCIFVFGCIQMLRRAVWNMLYVQSQHVTNIQNLNSLPLSFGQLNQQISIYIKTSKAKLGSISLQRLQQPDVNLPPISSQNCLWEENKEKQMKGQMIKIQEEIAVKVQSNAGIISNIEGQYENEDQNIEFLFKYQ